MKFFSYICNCVALDTGMCDEIFRIETLVTLALSMYICEMKGCRCDTDAFACAPF